MVKAAETVRRLQIAAIGLFSVILVGSLTRVIADQVSEDVAPEEIDVVTGEPLPATGPAEPAPTANVDEPLAELGVQPTVERPQEQVPADAP